MFLPLIILGVASQAEKISCYRCTYAWYDSNGENNGITGESSCRDGPSDKVALVEVEKFGTSEKTGAKWQNKCVTAHLTGNETVHLANGDLSGPKVDFLYLSL